MLAVLAFRGASALPAPSGLVSRSGSQSVVLHWERSLAPSLSGYRVYRSLKPEGPFVQQCSTLTQPAFCELSVSNGATYFYRVTALTSNSQESPPSLTLSVLPHAFASDDDFLDYVQQTSLDYFWYTANPGNGLIPDRTAPDSPCSIAAVGFGLSAIAIGVDHGWISRTQAAARVLTTLNTFSRGPQGPDCSGTMGYKGWYYHFLDMNTGLRAPRAELSSMDTALFLGGVLHAKQFFNGTDATESSLRSAADTLLDRIDWNWMAQGTNAVAMGWDPASGFLAEKWIGYNEGMLIYCLGLGAATNPLPADSWSKWASGYTWGTCNGQSYVPFSPLFGHQYSHCWIDFRHVSDSVMNEHGTSYFENSRRATLAQYDYAIHNPNNFPAYGSNVWGLTASDGPFGYTVHGIPPNGSDDGTIAPTAAAGSIPFAPEICIPTLRHLYNDYRAQIWSAYGFRDAFNTASNWFASDELGIDQGPFVIMIENYRTQRVWNLFMQNPEVQRGLQRAGFSALSVATVARKP